MLGFITTFSCISSFLFGYDLGLMGGALLHIKQSMGTTDAIDGIIVGAAKLGAVLGTFLGGSFMLYYGRRKAIAVDSGFFLVGPIVMAFAWNVEGLVIGRLIVGMGIGISAVVVPAYLGEVSPAKVRGRVVELYEVMLCFGMLSAALVDAALDAVPGNWRWMVGAPAIPALIMAVAAMYLPESPRWLVTEGRLDEALAVMHKIHTSQVLPQGVQESTAVVEDELLQLWSSVEQDKAATAARLQEFVRRRGGQGIIRWVESSGLRTEEDGDDLIPTDTVDDAYQQQMHHRDAINSEKGDATLAAPPPAAAHLVGIPAQLTRIRTSRSTDRLAALDAKANANANAKAAPQRQEQSAHASDDRDAPETSSIALFRDAQTSDAPSVSHQQHRYSSHKEPATSNQQLRPTGCAEQLPQGTDSRTHDGDFLHVDDDVRCEGSSQQGGGASRVSGDPLEGFSVQRPPGFWAVAWNVLRDVVLVSRGPERSAFRMILILAFFNQAFASTAIINYAPTVLRRAGVSGYATAELLTSLIGASKLIGVSVAFFLVDSLGRRPLLLWGSIGCTSALVVLMAADAAHSTWLLLLGMCSFVLSFSLSWAGVFWVILSEVFSMTSKSPAAFAATATLFLTGAAADLLFLTIHKGLGAFSFLLYALIALAAAIYVAMVVPETKGRTLQEVQNILQSSRQGRHGVHEAASLSWDGEQLMPPGMQQRGSSEGAGVQLPEKGMGKDKHRFPLVDRWR